MGAQETRPGQPSSVNEGQPVPNREARVRELLAKTEAILVKDHFVYTSGRHGEAYVNKDAVYPHTQATKELCRMLAEDFAGQNVEVVIGPAMGGIILQQWTADELSAITGREVLGIYTEKGLGESFVVKRGYDDLVPGRRVLVVEDVLTTGGSAKKVVDLVRQLGGEVVGLAVICNRGGVKPEDVGVDAIDALLNVSMESWPEEECPLCQRGVPVNTKVGKGREFLQRKGINV